MNYRIAGIHKFLFYCPIWATALILYAMTDGVMYLGRDLLEGIGYQIAYSAKFGDAALIGVVFIASTVIQRGLSFSTMFPSWFLGRRFHLAVWFFSVVLGAIVCAQTLEARSGQAMDIYHDVVIAPMILYFAVTLLPVIYIGGRRTEKMATVLFILFWMSLVAFDVIHNRINQRQWMEDHGIVVDNSRLSCLRLDRPL